MANALAKLDDLKSRMGWGGSTYDTLGQQLLDAATSIAEGPACAARRLRRQVDLVEYPSTDMPNNLSRMITLQVAPIESIASIKQLYEPSSDASFEAEQTLVEFDEWVIPGRPAGDARNMGVIERVASTWYGRTRCLQVIYTAGFIAPATESIPDGAITPPEDLQQAVIDQATLMWNLKDRHGNEAIEFGNDAGSTKFDHKHIHPALIEATQRLRRYRL